MISIGNSPISDLLRREEAFARRYGLPYEPGIILSKEQMQSVWERRFEEIKAEDNAKLKAVQKETV